MMVTIYKVRIDSDGRALMPFHRGAKIVACQMQAGYICLWYMCNTETSICDRLVSIYGTGHAIRPEAGDHVGTVQDGSLVWHVFVGTEELRV